MKALAHIPDMVQRNFGDGIRNQNMLRDWLGKQAVPIGGMAGSQMFQDILEMKKKQDEILNTPAHKPGS
jgi:hypothetical protein